ncbi:MAG: class I SAM-dependent rRNA methyltransferase, partial [Bacteroidales bacterium]
MEAARIILKSGKERSVRRFHPWIFSGAIRIIDGSPAEGDIVKVYDNKDNFLAVGHYQPGSIAVRILSFEEVEPDIGFYRMRIRNALNYRTSIGLTADPGTNVFRLVHAEGDNLPGLIIDFYNGVIVMQMHSVGMYRIREEISRLL